MSGNDEAGNSKSNPTGPLSLDDAERLASHFTPLWEDLPGTGDDGLEAPAGLSRAATPASAVPQSTPPPPAEPVAPELAPPVELTPSMVAIAAPMGSSPEIDPASTELPIRRSDYAPPRPLAVPQRTMVGLAPPPPVQVAPSATTTPLGIAAPPPSPPVLHVVAEVAPALEALERDSDVDLPDTLPPKRRTGVVLGVMGVAVALCAAVGIRALFFGGSKPDSIATPMVETARTASPTTNPVPAPTAVVAAPPTATNASSATAVAEDVPSTPPSAEPAPSASSLSGENSNAAAAPPAPGVELAASRSAPQAVPSKPVAEPKPHSPQRVEETKRVRQPPRPPAVKHPHAETPRTPVSPPLPGGGAIVRQTPF